jgi:transposase
MSKFSPLGSCQRQFLKKIDSSAPAVIPRGFLNKLGFAMWTPTTRQQHSRTVTRYQTDLTDAEWQVIAPHLPKSCATGRPREWPMREILNGIFYAVRAGCPWRLLPNDLPPWETIYRWFAAWRDDGRFERINHTLVMADRERVGRDASPSAAIIDSQSVKTTEAGGPRGYDAGKKVNGRKRRARLYALVTRTSLPCRRMLMLGNPPNGVMLCNKPLDGFRFAIGPENIDLPASPGIFPRHESWSLLGYHPPNMRLWRPGSSQLSCHRPAYFKLALPRMPRQI